MTDAELQAIRERVAKATPGPWEFDGLTAGSAYKKGMQGSLWLETVAKNERGDGEAILMPMSCSDELYGSIDGMPADMDFIAHARQDIPALLAEIDRLRALLLQVQEDVG